jgi:hypothetical protein
MALAIHSIRVAKLSVEGRHGRFAACASCRTRCAADSAVSHASTAIFAESRRVAHARR